MNKIELILQAMPGTVAQIVERTGLARNKAWALCKTAADNGLAHVEAYVLSGGNKPVPVYREGAGVNTPKPEPQIRDMAAMSRKRRDKQRGAPPRPWTRRASDEFVPPTRTNPQFDLLNSAFFGRSK